MFKNYKNWLKSAVVAALLGWSPEMFAQAVIFPQEKQAGIAAVDQQGEVFTLKNDLLSATFKKQGNRLTFGGCAAMDMLPNDEIFKIETGNGTEVFASQMTLKDVKVVELTPDANAAKGSFLLPGKAIEAHYTYQGLELVWRAILRNDSHYLRTELEIKANRATKMHAIIPMMYTIDNSKNEKAPNVVGNTRGAILMSDKIFAGLETPMGINTVKSAGSDEFDKFDAYSWNPMSFRWNPGDELPTAIKAENVMAMRGYLKFYTKGKNTITFTKTSGQKDLKIAGVDVVDLQGKVVAQDYHEGVAGASTKDNAYQLDIPEVGNYLVRYYVSTSDGVDSKGQLEYDHDILQAKVVFDGVAAKSSKKAAFVGTRALSGNTIGENGTLTDSWTPGDWKDFTGTLPWRIGELGFNKSQIKVIEQDLNITSEGALTIEFLYTKGNHRLNIAGVGLYDEQGNEATYDFHIGFTGGQKKDNVYTLYVPNTGKFKLRYYVETKSESIDSDGKINLKLKYENIVHLPAPKLSEIEGRWSRNVNLEAGKTWNVSAVVGLVAKDQPRRSVLSYVERERAVPWRAYPIYNSWYELNINRNNDRNYDGNMHDYQCSEVVKQWQQHLYEPYGAGIKAFVWDDGWDQYGTWTFNKNFPNGFTEQDKLAKQMESGIGAWLGPVGGYGQSGNYRRDYWSGNGGMVLGNPKYYKVFYTACDNLMNKLGYDFRYFKFDGISAQFSSVGPDGGTQGEENAEAIIYAELDLRKIKNDIFFNTSVGTWASPFWFSITDAVWRQENDYGTIGNNKSDRENWITYRDRLVYQNFVKNSPMCPINNLMTHGFILSDFGGSRDRNYDGILRELRCAFACGSAMVELYCDYNLMNNIKDNNGVKGALWKDLAECIEWQKKNAEVLPDIHWVGGNPWNGSSAEVYGWAAWNGKNAVLTLRNGANEAQTFTTTLRKALEIPAYVKGTITLNKGFEQADLEGLQAGQPIDIDQTLTLNLPGSSVYVFDNTPEIVVKDYVVTDLKQVNNRTAYTVKSVDKGYIKYDPADPDFLRSSYTEGNRVDATPTGAIEEQFAFLRNDSVPAGHYFMYAMGAKKFVTPQGSKLALTADPVETVVLEPVATSDNQLFVVKFGDKSINLTSNGDYFGTKLENVEMNSGNQMTVTAVNHKADLAEARAKLVNLYKYNKLDRSNWTVEASSWCQDSGENGAAGNVIDNNPASFWHSNYKADGVGEQKMPYTLTFNLGKVCKFNSFGYQPRQDSENGRVKSYSLSVSKNQQDWKVVKSGELKLDGNSLCWTDLGKTVEAQFVRFLIASNEAGNDLACMSEFFLSYDGSAVSPEMYNLPLFSTQEAPIWYPVTFKRGGANLADQGAEQKLKTAAAADVDAQKWQFIGNEYSYIMKSKAGNFMTFKDGRFYGTATQADATEMEMIQNGKFFLEMRPAGSGSCLNQVGGGGAGRELGTWNAGDAGNVFQVMEVTVPDPELPVFSDEKNVCWYTIQFKNGQNVIEDKGEGASVRLAQKSESEKQLWKLVGNRNNFQIVGKSGLYLVLSDEAEPEVGPNAGANPHPVRAMAAAYTPGFKLVVSKNETYAPAWEIASNDSQFNGKCFNQHAGTQVDRTIGFWNANDNNNPVTFVGLPTGVESVIISSDASHQVYSVSGVKMGADTQKLQKGVYIIDGKKMIVK